MRSGLQVPEAAMSCSIQKRNAVCVQKRNSTAGQVLGIQAAAKFGFAGFFALELAPAGACRAAEAARPAVCQAPDGAWVASPQSPILRRSDSIFVPSPGTDNKKQPTGLIIPLLTAQTCPLLIAPPQCRKRRGGTPRLLVSPSCCLKNRNFVTEIRGPKTTADLISRAAAPFRRLSGGTSSCGLRRGGRGLEHVQPGAKTRPTCRWLRPGAASIRRGKV